MMNKKGGMAISVGLLVLATLLLTSFALYTFITKGKSVNEIVGVPAELVETYIIEEQVRFYLAHSGELDKVEELFEVKLDEIDDNYFIVERGGGDGVEISYKFKVEVA